MRSTDPATVPITPAVRAQQRSRATDSRRPAPARPDDEDAAAIDLREEHLDHRHGHHGGEPHHRAPGRGKPQPDPGDEIDDGEKHRRRTPGDGVLLEAAARRRADAAQGGPMIEPLHQRDRRHEAQEQHQIFGPGAGGRGPFAVASTGRGGRSAASRAAAVDLSRRPCPACPLRPRLARLCRLDAASARAPKQCGRKARGSAAAA